MKKRISGIPFCTNRHYNCLYVMLDSLLRYYQWEPSLPAFYNWDFFYFRGESFNIRSRPAPLFSMIQRFGIKPFDETSDDGRAAWNQVKKRLDADAPVSINLDVFHLAGAGFYPRQRHSDHQCIVAGYDDGAGTVHLIDPSPWQPSARDIPLDLFLSCWDTRAIAGADQPCFDWLWLDVPDEPPRVRLRHVVAILQRNIASMSATSIRANCVPGVAGIEQFAEDVEIWTECEKQLLKTRLNQCTELFLEIALNREGHGAFLHYASRICGLDGLSALGREFESISQSWFVAKNLCFKGVVKETPRLIPRIQARLHAIAIQERKALDVLAAHSQTLSRSQLSVDLVHGKDRELTK